ncbi:cytochrome c [Bremerella sp. JC817]|uniref:c-type cytochrome n=1 Tax=Bremerella sp. JC817 TaxID=3231756 RepID=UPI00345990AD
MHISQAPEFGGRHWAGGLAVTALIGVIVGCSSEPAKFEPNRIAMHKAEITLGITLDPKYQVEPIAKILSDSFGTPDEPIVPEVEDIDQVFDLEHLKMAAGPYGSEEDGTPRGLYRQHCVHCHGITGNGRGPTAAFLNPYPRDFRMGKYKWKSTKTGTPPTHDDLKRVISDGVPGTAMPSFKLLPEEEIEALTQYVKYLSLRGELERNLLLEFSDLDCSVVKPADQRTKEEKEYVASLSPEEIQEETDDLNSAVEELTDPEVVNEDFLAPLVEGWAYAFEDVTEVPEKPESELKESLAVGRDLFFNKGGCATCHGQSALGDGQTAENFYDDWTEEYYDPKDPSQLEGFLALGALPPRKLDPRNLRLGNFRGGRRPVDVYWRIRNGIEGAKMPAAQQLSEEEIWHVVDYVRKGLPYDSLSQPPEHEQENVRVRN